MNTYYITTEEEPNGYCYQDVVRAESADEAIQKVLDARKPSLGTIDIDAYKDEEGNIYVWTRGFAKDKPYIRITRDMIAVLAAWSGIPNERFISIIRNNTKELTTL